MRKGFTLIELLAVIVILAIIALIATPIVLNIIKDSRESAGLRSAEMYLDAVEQAISIEKMNNTKFNPNSCTIEKGNLNCEGYDKNPIEVEVNGEVPQTGKITFEKGKITEVILKYETSTIVKNEEGNLVYGDDESGSKGEVTTLAAGLYDENDVIIMSWQELLDAENITVSNSNSLDYFDDSLSGKLVIDENITNISDGVFSFSGLNQVILPKNITNIGDYAFQGSDLESIIIPDNITELKYQSFYDCKNFSSITISNKIVRICTESLSGSNLNSINYKGTQEQWNKISFEDDWNYGCPEITVHCTDGDIVIPAS